MGLVNFVFSTIGTCIEIVSFLLDLNFIIVHSLIRFVVACVTFVHNLPTLLIDSVAACWHYVVFCLISLAQSAAVGAHGALSVLGGVLESLKMVGHLSAHVWLRGREQLHRGALSLCEACSIAVSLAVYLVNSAVNVVLIAAQNLYGVVVAAFGAVSSPLQMMFELILTLLTFLHSGLVGTSLYLWNPLSLALECLFSLAHLLFTVFVFNVYGLLLTVSVFLAATLYLNPELAHRGARYANSLTHRGVRYVNSLTHRGVHYADAHPRIGGLLGSLRRLRRSASRIPGALRRRTMALRRLFLLQESGLWQRLSGQAGRLGQSLASRLRPRLSRLRARPTGAGGDRVGGDGDPGEADGAGRRAPPDGRAGGAGQPLEHPHHRRRLPQGQPEPGSSTARPLQKLSGSPGEDAKAGAGLLSLLNEQEERKRCVICQDNMKTVVLLPCRHLCLCKDCTSMLLRQPIYLQNCPLCRHMILNTMDVYL